MAITVMEIWTLKPEYTDSALMLMQTMDDLVGPNAHQNSGWAGHATFLQSKKRSNQVIMLYRWRDRTSHETLRRQEEPLLRLFCKQYCARPRKIQYFEEMPVEVEHEHDEHAA